MWATCTLKNLCTFVIAIMWIAKPRGAVYLEHKLGFNFQLVTYHSVPNLGKGVLLCLRKLSSSYTRN